MGWRHGLRGATGWGVRLMGRRGVTEMAGRWPRRAVRVSAMKRSMARMQVTGVGLPDMSVAARATGKTEESKECGRHSTAKEAGYEHRVHGILTFRWHSHIMPIDHTVP